METWKTGGRMKVAYPSLSLVWSLGVSHKVFLGKQADMKEWGWVRGRAERVNRKE